MFNTAKKLIEWSASKQQLLFLLFYIPMASLASLGLGGQGFFSLNYYVVICGFCMLSWGVKVLGAGYKWWHWGLFLIAMVFQLYNASYNGDRLLILTPIAVFWNEERFHRADR